MKYQMKCMEGDEPRIIVTPEFVSRNKLAIDYDAARNLMHRETDFLNFGREVAVDYLTFNECREFLKDEYIQKVKAGELEYKRISDVNEAAQDFLDYMVFAWTKAVDERGLSAERSIIKLSAWMEILSRKDVANILNNKRLYNPYGRRALKAACKELGIQYPKYL